MPATTSTMTTAVTTQKYDPLSSAELSFEIKEFSSNTFKGYH